MLLPAPPLAAHLPLPPQAEEDALAALGHASTLSDDRQEALAALVVQKAITTEQLMKVRGEGASMALHVWGQGSECVSE
jgi:hypothetical protein